MENTHLFLRMGRQSVENARTAIDFTLMQLQMRTQQLATVFDSLGEGVIHVNRPWVLLFTRQPEALKEVLKDKPLEARTWLQDIRICHIETIHQIKALLCSIHMRDASGTNLLTWIQSERQGQPPCLIVVIDLLRLLLPLSSRDPKEIRHDDLARTLALLAETCNYLSIHARKQYDNAFGLETGCTTDLLVTDEGVLESIDPANDRDKLWMEKALNIIDFYIDRTM